MDISGKRVMQSSTLSGGSGSSFAFTSFGHGFTFLGLLLLFSPSTLMVLEFFEHLSPKVHLRNCLAQDVCAMRFHPLMCDTGHL